MARQYCSTALTTPLHPFYYSSQIHTDTQHHPELHHSKRSKNTWRYLNSITHVLASKRTDPEIPCAHQGITVVAGVPSRPSASVL
jgi:hypothetical protein